MGTVIMHNVVSVDGFIADGNDGVGPLHDRYFSGDTPITEGPDGGGGGEQFEHSGAGSGFKVSSASARYVRPMWQGIAVIVMGRTLSDPRNGWEGSRPRATTWSWCPTGPSLRAVPRGASTTSSIT